MDEHDQNSHLCPQVDIRVHLPPPFETGNDDVSNSRELSDIMCPPKEDLLKSHSQKSLQKVNDPDKSGSTDNDTNGGESLKGEKITQMTDPPAEEVNDDSAFDIGAQKQEPPSKDDTNTDSSS